GVRGLAAAGRLDARRGEGLDDERAALLQGRDLAVAPPEVRGQAYRAGGDEGVELLGALTGPLVGLGPRAAVVVLGDGGLDGRSALELPRVRGDDRRDRDLADEVLHLPAVGLGRPDLVEGLLVADVALEAAHPGDHGALAAEAVREHPGLGLGERR